MFRVNDVLLVRAGFNASWKYEVGFCVFSGVRGYFFRCSFIVCFTLERRDFFEFSRGRAILVDCFELRGRLYVYF